MGPELRRTSRWWPEPHRTSRWWPELHRTNGWGPSCAAPAAGGPSRIAPAAGGPSCAAPAALVTRAAPRRLLRTRAAPYQPQLNDTRRANGAARFTTMRTIVRGRGTSMTTSSNQEPAQWTTGRLPLFLRTTTAVSTDDYRCFYSYISRPQQTGRVPLDLRVSTPARGLMDGCNPVSRGSGKRGPRPAARHLGRRPAVSTVRHPTASSGSRDVGRWGPGSRRMSSSEPVRSEFINGFFLRVHCRVICLSVICIVVSLYSLHIANSY